MFTPDDRARVRSELLERASGDARISGAAITGSGAAAGDESREDEWSDVDLALGVHAAGEVASVLADWTAHMYERHRAVHHVDVLAGAWTYRVFLLADTLQVDIAFVAGAEFRALAPSFRLMFGNAREPRYAPAPPPGPMIGMAWLYALHARSSLARRRLWQAEYMISGVRDHALALACLRHGLPAAHGRGLDLLPAAVLARFEDALARRIDAIELARAFQAATQALLDEMRLADAELAGRLAEVVAQLAI